MGTKDTMVTMVIPVFLYDHYTLPTIVPIVSFVSLV